MRTISRGGQPQRVRKRNVPECGAIDWDENSIGHVCVPFPGRRRVLAIAAMRSTRATFDLQPREETVEPAWEPPVGFAKKLHDGGYKNEPDNGCRTNALTSRFRYGPRRRRREIRRPIVGSAADEDLMQKSFGPRARGRWSAWHAKRGGRPERNRDKLTRAYASAGEPPRKPGATPQLV